MSKKIGIIGGGAAGIFCAIHLSKNPNHEIHIFEKSDELLKKVKISGGGRCNVTHNYVSQAQFTKNYPRGGAILKKNFDIFSPLDMQDWLETRGVKLKTEEDGRIFPKTDSSQTIIDLFLNELKEDHIHIHFRQNITAIKPDDNKIELKTDTNSFKFDYVVVASGGPQKERDLDFLTSLDLSYTLPVPSLFTFKIQDKDLTELMGLSVAQTTTRITGTDFKESGPLLITHWGLSGPGILKLSSWAAFHLNALNYQFQVQINWLNMMKDAEAEKYLAELKTKHHVGKIANHKPSEIPQRLWQYFLAKADIDLEKKWMDMSKKEFNKLIHLLIQSVYDVKGKTTYKEEFVTAGGIDTDQLDSQTMSLKKFPNIYCIGEITNMDGITGGFNFQNAWTSAVVCAKDIIKKS